jgi:hypothetical protein
MVEDATIVWWAIYKPEFLEDGAMNYRFDEEKATQASAYLINKYGGTLNYMKLIKLLYLSNRISFERFGEPIVPDTYVSMKNGPVLSCVLDSISNSSEIKGYWAQHIVVSKYPCATLINDPGKGKLNRQSLSIMDEVDEIWHDVDRFKMVEWMHANLTEWEDPNGSALRIPVKRILKAVGKSDEEITQIIQEEMTYQEEAEILGSIENIQEDGFSGAIARESLPTSACSDL